MRESLFLFTLFEVHILVQRRLRIVKRLCFLLLQPFDIVLMMLVESWDRFEYKVQFLHEDLIGIILDVAEANGPHCWLLFRLRLLHGPRQACLQDDRGHEVRIATKRSRRNRRNTYGFHYFELLCALKAGHDALLQV